MRDDDKGLSHLVAKAEKQSVQLLSRLRVEVARRLVGQHHCGLVDKGASHSDALLLATRELRGLVVFSVDKIQVFKKFHGFLRGFFFTHAPDICRDADVFDGSELG